MSDQAPTPDPEPQAPEPQAEPQGSPEGPPAWLAPIEARMDELRDSHMTLAEQLRQQTDYDDDELPIEELYDDDGELTPEAAQALIDERVAEGIRQQLGERDAQTALSQRDDAWDDLLERIPALAQRDVSGPLVNEIAAALEARGHGGLIETPEFVDYIEATYKARQFDEREQAEQPQQVVLESAGGAAPQQQQQEDWSERIVKAAERLRPTI